MMKRLPLAPPSPRKKETSFHSNFERSNYGDLPPQKIKRDSIARTPSPPDCNLSSATEAAGGDRNLMLAS